MLFLSGSAIARPRYTRSLCDLTVRISFIVNYLEDLNLQKIVLSFQVKHKTSRCKTKQANSLICTSPENGKRAVKRVVVKSSMSQDSRR